MKTPLLIGLLTFWATTGWAHSPLEASVPADTAVVTAAPDEIALTFKNKIRLTRVTLSHASQEVVLDLEGSSGFVADYTIPMQPMGDGAYLIEWRGLGDDGHPMTGTFGFTVAP